MELQTLEQATLLARRELWLLVSVGYVDPSFRLRFGLLRDPALRQRACDAAALLAQEQPAIELGPGEVIPKEATVRDLFAALDSEWESIEATYRLLFGLTAISQQCPPCEIEFEPNSDVAFRSERLADVAGFYQAFGLEISPRAQERLDHISVECEFLYVLLAKEAAAVQAGNREGMEVCRDARRKFFQEHAGWWLPAFCRLLPRFAPPGFYRQLATLTAGMSTAERVSLGLPAFETRVLPKPSSAGTEGACSECLGGQQGL